VQDLLTINSGILKCEDLLSVSDRPDLKGTNVGAYIEPLKQCDILNILESHPNSELGIDYRTAGTTNKI